MLLNKWIEWFSKPKKTQNKKVVYTVILAGYDNLKIPELLNPDFDYVCFTDDVNLRSDVWQIRKVSKPRHLNPKRFSSEFSIYPFNLLKDYDLSVYVNGTISIHCDIGHFVNTVLPEGKSIAIMIHPRRNCVYKEAEKVIELKKDVPEIVNKQMKKYKALGYPENNGLVSGGIIIRRHNDNRLRKHCRLWHREIKKNSQRDQLSFNFVLWKNKLIEPAYFSPECRLKDFLVHPHNYVQKF